MGDKAASIPLGELVDAQRGISYCIVQPGQPVPDGVPIIRVTDIRDGRVSSANPLRVAPDIAAKYRRTTLRGGELLLTLVGTVGETAIAPAELAGWNTARAVAVIPVLSDPGPQWLRYALQTGESREYIDTRLNTTVQATLNLGDVSTLPIPMPDRGTRERIINILGSLDDKIELNRRTNETLEAMARALFKSWFVDFDPVRAKAEGRQPSGMDAETAKLFPSELVESELREIPKGWRVATVGELAVLSGGKQLERDQITADGAIPVFGGAGIMGFTSCHNADGFVISVGRVGAYCGQFFAHRGKAWINNNASLIRPKDARFSEWLFIALRHADIEVIKKGAAQPFVFNGDVAKLPIFWPGEQAIASFSSLLDPLLAAKDANDGQSKALSAIRDALLPRLLSGELPVTADNRALEAQA